MRKRCAEEKSSGVENVSSLHAPRSHIGHIAAARGVLYMLRLDLVSNRYLKSLTENTCVHHHKAGVDLFNFLTSKGRGVRVIKITIPEKECLPKKHRKFAP